MQYIRTPDDRFVDLPDYAFERPFLCAFGDEDKITAGNDAPFRAKVPGAAVLEHRTMVGGGHFLQEDVGPELATVIGDLIAATA